MIFRDYSTTGDGLVCALQILRIMKTTTSRCRIGALLDALSATLT